MKKKIGVGIIIAIFLGLFIFLSVSFGFWLAVLDYLITGALYGILCLAVWLIKSDEKV